MRVLIHGCCGPCLIEPLEALAAEHEVVVHYCNPNIHPLEEYRRRRDVLAAHAAAAGVEMIEGPYDPRSWIAAVAGRLDDAPSRCAACFGLRLGMTARAAADGGFDAFATTLTVSPYQDPEAIRRAGEEASGAHGVRYLPTDFRDRYRSSVERSKECGMYRQRYCGCILSEIEADEARARRKRRSG